MITKKYKIEEIGDGMFDVFCEDGEHHVVIDNGEGCTCDEYWYYGNCEHMEVVKKYLKEKNE